MLVVAFPLERAPLNRERIRQIGESLTEATKPIETLQRRARAATATAARAMHDDRMRAEASFRSDAGLRCTITRATDGNCCAWCSAMAGQYEYGSEPPDIYRRHDNCGCTVTFACRRKRQDVWSKRTWEAPENPPGAEPRRLTREEALAAQQKNAPQVLTNGVKHGKLNTEEQKFLERIIADPDMTPEYRQILMDRFTSGTPLGQKAFTKFVGKGSVSTTDYAGTAHYSPKTKSINMNYISDQIDLPGAYGFTWFHEHGHQIDHALGWQSVSESEFLSKLRSDFCALVQYGTGAKGTLSYSAALDILYLNPNFANQMAWELSASQAQQIAVSDIMQGLSMRAVNGCYGHPKNQDGSEYWNNGSICEEAFAHMFEAQFDEARYRQMKMWFPNAFTVFEKMLGGAVK